MTSANTRRIGVLATSVLVLGFAACGSPPTAASLVSAGLKAQLAGDDSTAESTYQQAIKLDPDNAVAHYDLGTVYDRQGNKSQAESQYTATLVIQPTFTDALFNLADDTASSDPTNAATLYAQVLTLQPSFAAAWLNLGFILEGEGHTAEAKADWAKAVALEASLASRIPTPSPDPAKATVTPKA
ncbi:MAG: tetratricopeptide repeat protein [Candidatus Dormibacteria bacterium]|jgi:Flp pilus assembly protein TadD